MKPVRAVRVPRVEDEEVAGFLRVVRYVLVRERRRQGLAQEELAWRAGVSRSAVSLLESGRRDPGVGLLVRVAEALGGLPGLLRKGHALWLRCQFPGAGRELPPGAQAQVVSR